MNLRIEELRYNNIREFENLVIDFTRDTEDGLHHISLVQMPNGTGKTTSMQLIRQLIRGADLDEDQVYDYEPDFGASTGEFTIGFRSGNDRFRVHMHLDYDTGNINYTHSYPQREGGGKNDGHFMPTQLEENLTEELVDLFVFNGELTEEFIETSENKAESALKIVNQLDRIENQKDFIEDIIEKRQRESEDGTETEQGLKMAKTNLEKRRKKLEELENKREELQGKVEEHTENIEKLEEDLEDIIAEEGDKLEKYKEYEEEIQKLQSKLKNESSDILQEMRRPSRLSKQLNENFDELLEHMTVLSLPKSTSQEFFTELAEGSQCICDRQIKEEQKAAILKNAEEYLSDEDIGVLNTLKEQLRNSADTVNFKSRLDDISKTREELKNYRMKKRGLNLEDPERQKKKEEIIEDKENEKNQRENKKLKIKFLTTDDKRERDRKNLDWKSNIPAAKREVNKFETKVEEATGTVLFSKRADKVSDMFDDFVSDCLDNLKESQIDETNEKLSQILKRSQVQIDSIDDSIKLKNQSGSSEGQSLAVAYAYLSTLFENSEADMPFIVDSPAVSLDHKVRSEVASTVSDLFDQLIAFVISTEKEGFVENLSAEKVDGSEDIQYYTIYKTGEPGIVDQHKDKEFFMQFESEEDETNRTPGVSD